MRRRIYPFWVAPLLGLAVACSPESETDAVSNRTSRVGATSQTGAALAESLSALSVASPVQVDQAAVAEALALNTRSTELQREALERQLVGNVVQWTVAVFEVTRDGDAYRILSQPLPITESAATPLLRVLATVFPRSDQDRTAIEQLRTGDKIVVKGSVRSITLRTFATLHPAVLAGVGSHL